MSQYQVPCPAATSYVPVQHPMSFLHVPVPYSMSQHQVPCLAATSHDPCHMSQHQVPCPAATSHEPCPMSHVPVPVPMSHEPCPMSECHGSHVQAAVVGSAWADQMPCSIVPAGSGAHDRCRRRTPVPCVGGGDADSRLRTSADNGTSLVRPSHSDSAGVQPQSAGRSEFQPGLPEESTGVRFSRSESSSQLKPAAISELESGLRRNHTELGVNQSRLKLDETDQLTWQPELVAVQTKLVNVGRSRSSEHNRSS